MSRAFSADDSLMAAAVPNATIATYLERRKTTDPGINQRRLQFLVPFADTLGRRLAEPDTRLRQFEDASGVLDPELSGKIQVERAMALREQLEQGEVEEAARAQMITRVHAGSLNPQQLAAITGVLASVPLSPPCIVE